MIGPGESTLQLSHRVAVAPRRTQPSRYGAAGVHHTVARVKASGNTQKETQGHSLVSKLLYNAASLLHLDRSTAHCLHCKGSGFETCSSCKGSGIHGKHVSGGLETNRCIACHGRGVCQCPHCQGKGRR